VVPLGCINQKSGKPIYEEMVRLLRRMVYSKIKETSTSVVYQGLWGLRATRKPSIFEF